METINLPDSILDKCRKPIKETYTKYTGDGFAFVLSRLSQTQIAYQLFEQLSTFHTKNPYDEIIFYSLNNELPIAKVSTSIFPATSLNEHIGAVIATCPMTWNLVNAAYADIQRYFYVFDPLLFKFLNPALISQIAESNFVFILRTKEHRSILSQFPSEKISDIYIPHAELNLFKEIIGGKNSSKK